MLPKNGVLMRMCTKRSVYVALWVTFCAITTVISWRCDDGSRDIRDEWLCDHGEDCSDGSDEASHNCVNKTCEVGMFRCQNTRCIDQDLMCDGEADCLDGDSSDEDPQVCMQTYGATLEEVGKGACYRKFICEAENACISRTWVCDGEMDCSDGSDEGDCPCEGDELSCHIGGGPWCLEKIWQCDGVQHCDAGEDEAGCKKIDRFDTMCDGGLYQCRSTDNCVPWDHLCDQQINCEDGSDEGGLCFVDSCNKERGQRSCQHLCHNSPIGSVCICFDGFRLADDGVGCVDVDECIEMHSTALHNKKKLAELYYSGIKQICGHYCENFEGSFRCTCADGYSLHLDNYTCKANGANIPELFVVVGSEIRIASTLDPGTRGSFYGTIYKSDNPNETILDIAFYERASAMFWTEYKSGQLKMTSGSGVMTLITGLVPRAVCVDWLSRNLVITTNTVGKSAVHLMGLDDNRNQTELVVIQVLNGVTDPVSVAVYPEKGLLFVADSRSSTLSSRILISKFDGSQSTSLVHLGKMVPTDVIVDVVQEAVIWTSYDDDDAMVESVKFDGSDRGVIMSRRTGRFPIHPLSVSVFESHLYVTDKLSREVRSWYMHDIALYGKQNTLYDSKAVLKLRKHRIGVARMSHPVLQRPMKGDNPCDSAACDGICVLVPRHSLLNIVSSKSVKLDARCMCPNAQSYDKIKGRCEASQLSTATPIATGSPQVTGGVICDLVCPEREICVHTFGEKRCVCRDNHGDCSTEILESTVNVVISSSTEAVSSSDSTSARSDPQPSRYHALTTSEAIVTVLAISALLACVFVYLKCARKKKYSVDLRFSRAARKDVTGHKLITKAVRSEPASEAASSFTNPNRHQRRLLKPRFEDNQDSAGVPSSVSSRSSCSTLNGTESLVPRGFAKGNTSSRESSLVPEGPGPDKDFVVEGLRLGGMSTESGGPRGHIRRLEKMFKIRRTGSRERMFPQNEKDASPKFASVK